MVLAGPGSGKTFVIVERLRYLIEEYEVSPSSILVITFTKAAAIEMQQRFLKVKTYEKQMYLFSNDGSGSHSGYLLLSRRRQQWIPIYVRTDG